MSQTDSSITYGPYTNIEAFSENEMVIHSENNNPMLVVTRLQRVQTEPHLKVPFPGDLL